MGVLVTVLSVQTAWLSIDLDRFGSFSFSLSDLYTALFSSAIEIEALPLFVVISVAMFPLSIIAGLFSLAKRPLAPLFAVSNLIAGVLWTLGVDSIPSEVIHELGNIGATIPRQAITSGLGAYLVIGVAVVVIIAAYLTREQ